MKMPYSTFSAVVFPHLDGWDDLWDQPAGIHFGTLY